MDKIKIFNIILLCITLLYACEDKETETTLSVSAQEFLLSVSGLDDTDNPAVFEVTSNTNWKLRYYSWLTPSITTGESGSTQVSFTATPTTTERIGYITVVSGNVSEYIMVRQVPEELVSSTLTVAPTSIEVNADGITEEGASPAITISTNKDWTIAGLPEWVTVNSESGDAGTDMVITLTVDSNEGDSREESFTVVAGFRTETVTIRQMACLAVSPMSLEVDFEGKVEEGASPAVTISSTKNWTITGLPGWVTANPGSGSPGTDILITFTVELNEQLERNGNVVIQAGTRTETVAIKQLAEEQNLTVLPTSIQVKSAGTTDEGVSPTVTISTNKNWTITGLPGWVTANPASGNAGTDMVVTLTVGSTNEERNGSFMVNAGYLTETVTIYQQGDDAQKTIPFTIVENYLMTRTDHVNYWEFVTNPEGAPHILFAIQENCRGAISGTLSFEYQIVDDFTTLARFNRGWTPILDNQSFIFTGNGIDPDSEELWTPFSYGLKPAINAGWGDSQDWIFIPFSKNGLRFLIRNMKIVVELEN